MGIDFQTLIGEGTILRNIARHLPTMPHVRSLLSSYKSIGKAFEDTGTWAELRNQFLGSNVRNLPYRIALGSPKDQFRFLWEKLFPKSPVRIENRLCIAKHHQCDQSYDVIIERRAKEKNDPKNLVRYIRCAILLQRFDLARNLLKKLDPDSALNSLLFSEGKPTLDHSNLNKKDRLGFTPLQLAVCMGNIPTVRSLINMGARVDIPFKNDITDQQENILALAIHTQNEELVALLLDHADPRDPLPLCVAAQYSDLNIVRMLLDKGFQVNAQIPDNTPAHLVRVGISEIDWRLRTALFNASKHGQVEVIRLLAERGAKVDVVDVHGQSPLHVAMDAQTTDALLKCDAEPNTKFYLFDFGENITPLHCAIERENLDQVKLLIAAGAKIDTRAHELLEQHPELKEELMRAKVLTNLNGGNA